MVDWDYEASRCAIGDLPGQIPRIEWCVSDDPIEKRKHYEKVLPLIREAAKKLGYAIGLHGSLERDLDLIAVPWEETFCAPDELAHAVQRAASGSSGAWPEPIKKPHGRLGYVLHIGVYAYIDLSIIATASPLLPGLELAQEMLEDAEVTNDISESEADAFGADDSAVYHRAARKELAKVGQAISAEISRLKGEGRGS